MKKPNPIPLAECATTAHRLAVRLGLAHGVGPWRLRELILATEPPPSWWAEPEKFAAWKKRNPAPE